MSLSDELKELEGLLRSGTLTQEEFQLAKQRVLAGSPSAEPAGFLQEIRAQNEVAQLDREWALQREQYMVSGRRGSRHIPGKASSVLGGLFIVGFGICWTILALTIATVAHSAIGMIFPVFGVMFVVFGALMSLHAYSKAGQYQAGYERFQSRRNELLRKQRDA